MIGSRFLFDSGIEAMIEWLVVRAHPDDPTWVLLTPLDTFPFAGCADVVLDARPWIARCGECAWVPADACRELTDPVSADDLRRVREKIAALARGRADGDRTVDADPEYQEWMAIVAESRLRLPSDH